MKYIRNIAMLLAALFAVVAVSCSDDETSEQGADRLFRPVSVTLTPKGTTLTATWTGIKGAAGYWVELYTSAKVPGPGDTVLTDYQLVASNEMTTSTTWVVNGLAYNTTYYFRVKAIDPDMARNSYFSDFYSVKVPAMTEVLTCELLDPIEARVRFTWMEGYNIQFVKITAPDGGVRTVYVDDADGHFIQSGFASGTYTAVAGNTNETYNTAEFVIPVLYDVEGADITFDGVKFKWRVDADIEQLVCVEPGAPNEEIVFTLTPEQVNAGELDYAMSEGRLKPNTTYTAVLRYKPETGKEDSNTVTFTTMKEKPAGLVTVTNAEEFLKALTNGASVIAVMPLENGYVFTETLSITNDLTVMAATKKKPEFILKQFKLANGDKSLNMIRFEGMKLTCADKGNENYHLFDNKEQNMKGDIEHIEVEDCYISGFGGAFLRGFETAGGVIKNVFVNNCEMYDMTGKEDFIGLANKNITTICPATITFTNNTVTGISGNNQIGQRVFMKYRGSANTIVIVANNTFYDFHNEKKSFIDPQDCTIDGNSDRGILQIKMNIFYGKETPHNVAPNLSNIRYEIENNVVTYPWGVYTKDETGKEISVDDSSWAAYKTLQVDPAFKNAAKFDFTVTNEEVKKLGVGDPRWLK